MICRSLFTATMTTIWTLVDCSGMPDSVPQLGLELISTKASIEDGQLLTDEELNTAIRGFEEGGFQESKHAAGILSEGKMSKGAWDATSEYLFDLLEEASVVGTLDEDLPKAACKAARVIAKINSNTSVDPPLRTELGESLIRDGTGDEGNPWLTTAGTLLLSTAMDTGEYEPADEIAKRIAEHLLALSKNTDGTQEANLTAVGYGILGRTNNGDHAKTLVAESIDLREYLYRTESNLREGFLRFVARVAQEDPALLEPYTVELATHLRAESFAVRRDAARAFLALCDEVNWEALRPGVLTLNSPFERDGPTLPLFAIQFLQRVAQHNPEAVPQRVGDAFVKALQHDDRFTSVYGSEAAIQEDALTRATLFAAVETLAPEFPELADAVGNGVFDELERWPDEGVKLFVAAAAGCFVAVAPNVVGDRFIRLLIDDSGVGGQDGSTDTPLVANKSTKAAVSRFATRMAEFDGEKALSTADQLVTHAEDRGTPGHLDVVAVLLQIVHQKRDDDEVRRNFHDIIERVADTHEDEFLAWDEDVFDPELDQHSAPDDSE